MFRADAVVTATYLVTLSAPAVLYASVRYVRAGHHDTHRLIQAVHLIVCGLAVLGLELRIRFAGGSGALIAQAPPELHAWAARLLALHVSVAVATYALWTWLAIASWRRHGTVLPGSFSHRHRRIGAAVFGGLCFTAVSATGMFVLAFVL